MVLTEHFRCTPDIIHYSNSRNYNSSLVPLRIPTSSQLLDPSIVDVYLPSGVKEGKTNSAEAKYIVKEIQNFIALAGNAKKTIGVISLIGDSQAALIRNGLLSSIGPSLYKHHNINCGCAPSFQGSERDVIFISMVASPGKVYSQGQCMHRQRMNVAMSRAKDRVVVVRSLKGSEIVNDGDTKKDLIDWLAEKAKVGHEMEVEMEEDEEEEEGEGEGEEQGSVVNDVVSFLKSRKYLVSPMRQVWEGGFFVSNSTSGARAAIAVEFASSGNDDFCELCSQ